MVIKVSLRVSPNIIEDNENAPYIQAELAARFHRSQGTLAEEVIRAVATISAVAGVNLIEKLMMPHSWLGKS